MSLARRYDLGVLSEEMADCTTYTGKTNIIADRDSRQHCREIE